MPGIDDQAVNLDHPGHRILPHPAGQRPFGVEGVSLEQVTYRLGLGGPRGLRDSHPLVDVGHPHVVRLGGVAEEVHPADDPHDPAGPGLRLAVCYWRGAFACQLLSQTATQNGILFVEPLPAELVRHCDNQFKNRADFHRTLARCVALCHVFPVLVLVRESMSMVGVFYVSGTDQLTEGESLCPNGATSFPVQRRPLPLVSPPPCWTSPESLARIGSLVHDRLSSPARRAAFPIGNRPQGRRLAATPHGPSRQGCHRSESAAGRPGSDSSYTGQAHRSWR